MNTYSLEDWKHIGNEIKKVKETLTHLLVNPLICKNKKRLKIIENLTKEINEAKGLLENELIFEYPKEDNKTLTNVFYGKST